MPLTRRDFIRGTLTGGAVTSAFGFNLEPALAQARGLKIDRTTETRSICPYCAVSCGVIIHTLGDRASNVRPSVVHVEGDPDSPVNRGALCPKGITLRQFIDNDLRLTKPLYRAPGAGQWTEMEWDDAIDRMARLIKDTRDRGFDETDAAGRTVNRLTNTAMIGGCTDTNEINYLYGKLRFGLGIVPFENQARL
jgi:formate dehydrogenase major subunit